ncbi:MAG TPA: helix-turn-helix transcriptional regulator [Candidatus Dormibacteraeota bacterium]
MDLDEPEAPLEAAPGTHDVDALASALQDPTRRRILLALVHDGGARTVDEVATVAGVHRTVAFGHLERLVALGFLDKEQRRGRPGKPASLYSVRGSFLAMAYPARQFLLLAGLLGGSLSSLGAAGTNAARNCGRRYAQTIEIGPASSPEQALTPLDHLGAAYRVRGDDISATPCVFREACDSARNVVCALHAGILEGTLQASGIDCAVAPRGPVNAAGCHFGVSRTRARSRSARRS